MSEHEVVSRFAKRFGLGALALLGVLAFSTSAHAGGMPPCSAADSITTSSFEYAICGLPDLDQVREQTPSTPGLPGDGYNYCAPTSTMDALAYFASHGAPALRPGANVWTAPANYNEMSADILALGNLMGTTAAAGTDGEGYAKGLATWLTEKQPGVAGYPDPLVLLSHWATEGPESIAPSLATLAEEAAPGNVVLIDISFMQEEPSGSGDWHSVGGHVVSMSSAVSPDTLGIHDPATPITDHHYQAPYTQQSYTVTPVAAKYRFGEGESFPATYLRIDSYRNDDLFGAGTQAYITSSWTIEPETLFTWRPGHVETFASIRHRPPGSFATEAGLPIEGFALDPTAPRVLYAERGSSTIWALDSASGSSTPFAAVGAQPRAVAFAGRTRTLFTAAGGTLSAFDASGRRMASVTLGETVAALAVDQATGRLFALSTQSGRLRVFDSRLGLLGTIGVSQALSPGAGAVSMATQAGIVYIHRDGARAVALVAIPQAADGGMLPASVRSVVLRGGAGSRGLAVDDRGRIFVRSRDGRLAEFGPAGAPLASSPFVGRIVGARFAVSQSFSNAAPGSLHFVVDYLPPQARG